VSAERLIDFGLRGHAEAAEDLAAAYETLSGALEEAATRANAIRGRLSLPDELEAALKKEDPIAALKHMLDQWGKGRGWEKARIQEALGTAISRSDPGEVGEAEQQGKDADTYLKAALAWFAEHQPGHRRVTELHAERAEALALVPACSGEALAQAETAVTLNPLSARYRDVLASAYESGGDLDSAVRVAEVAVLLEPDVPRRHYRKAKLRWALAESLADPVAHDAQRREASSEFEQALTLYESDQKGERRATSWWLARSYFAMSDFNLVPPHLRFVLGSLTEDGAANEGDRLLTAAAEMWLAMTYRKLQDFHAAERHARRAIDKADALDDDTEKALKLIFPSEMDDEEWPLGLVLVLAHVQLASSRADRGARLVQANKSLEAARVILTRMKGIDSLADAYREGSSDYEAARGRVLLAQGKTDAAIDALNKAADLDPGEADVYLLLARAHVRATEERLEQDWQKHIRAARAACRRTREIGGEGHPDAVAAAELEPQLRKMEAQGNREFGAALRPPAEAPGDAPAHGRSSPDPFEGQGKQQSRATRPPSGYKKRAPSTRAKRKP
jgi:tetratricopeptide (TPR) repeat protein